MAKPTDLPRWATNALRTVEPSSGEKDVGWQEGFKPPARKMNWLLNVAYQWLDWFNARFFDGATANDLEVTGVDVITGTDQEGGDLDLSGGSSTGDGGSEITFSVAKAGQGTGATVRAPVQAGGFNDDGTFNLVPQAEPSGASAAGDISVDDEAKQPVAYNGNEWQRLLGKVFSIITSPTPISNTAVETVFSPAYTFKAGTLIQGATFRVRAGGEADNVTGTPNLVMRIRLGGLTGTLIVTASQTSVGAGANWILDGQVTIRTVGAGGTFAVTSFGMVQASMEVTDAPAGAVDTTIDNDLVVTAQWSAAAAGNSVSLSTFVVERA